MDGDDLSVGGDAAGVRSIDLASGRLLGTAAVSHPDNLSWASDGRLLAAGLVLTTMLVPVGIAYAVPSAWVYAAYEEMMGYPPVCN